MTAKTQQIINGSLTIVVGLIFIGSAMGKFFGGESSVQMAAGIGLTIGSLKVLGIVELVGVLLFIFPRTGILGTLILAAYMGGAIATHLTHGQPLIGPILIEAIIWIAAVVRFPELRTRISQITNQSI